MIGQYIVTHTINTQSKEEAQKIIERNFESNLNKNYSLDLIKFIRIFDSIKIVN